MMLFLGRLNLQQTPLLVVRVIDMLDGSCSHEQTTGVAFRRTKRKNDNKKV